MSCFVLNIHYLCGYRNSLLFTIKLFNMRKITLLLFIFACTIGVNAQALLIENFNYTIGTDIKSQGWNIHSGSGANSDSILVADGLTFTGYIGSGVGGAAAVVGRYADQNKTFVSQTSGTVYAAFMFQAKGAGATNTYFLHFGPSTIGTTFFTRVWVNAAGTGLGLGSSAPSTYVTVTLNTTYLVVIKYNTSTKESTLNVFSTMPSSEPTTADATFTETATIANVGSIALRQNQSSSVAAQNVIVDGIRVATSWTELMNATTVISGTYNPTTQSTFAYVSNHELILLNSTDKNIEIYSALGSKVKSAVVENSKVDISDLSKGLYIVRSNNLSQKFIIR